MRTIVWEVTVRCNLRCKHCFLYNELESPSTEPVHELSTEHCLRVVEQFEEANVFQVSILGGEPFCRPDIMVILQHLGEKRFWTTVETNGTLIDRDTARDLADTGIKRINVSLEGPDAKINDAIRGKGSFQKAVQGIKCLREFGIPFCIGMTVNKLNYQEIERMAVFCSNIGAEFASFGLYDEFPPTPFSASLSLGREEILVAARDVSKIKEDFPKGFISSNINRNLAFFAPGPKTPIKDERFIRCGLWSKHLSILSNGNVVPCTYMRNIALGNIMETHLSEIPELPAFRKFKELLSITVNEANEKCAACEWKYLCGGGCRGQAYLKYGSILAPDARKCLLARGEICD
ncbi:MAG: radical SAM protein [Theionarchaea archaeon]|nr:MAG: hypothetical protein AYK19_11045 [Theionarchaea archaeon DG-70-1]MBU7029482.1 radical SAM protein [Theionarchaea archaeon]